MRLLLWQCLTGQGDTNPTATLVSNWSIRSCQGSSVRDVYDPHSIRLVWDTNHLCRVNACGQARPKDAARQGCFAAPISFSDLDPRSTVMTSALEKLELLISDQCYVEPGKITLKNLDVTNRSPRHQKRQFRDYEGIIRYKSGRLLYKDKLRVRRESRPSSQP